jgi:predicted transcriptional regulator
MARRPSETLTAREAQIMDIVWRLGPATAEQVRAGLPDQPHDSTVRTLLRVLVSKGFLHRESGKRAYAYRAAIGRKKAQRHALRDITSRFFGGSVKDLVLRLIEDERLTPEQLDEIRRSARMPARPQRRAKGETS